MIGRGYQSARWLLLLPLFLISCAEAAGGALPELVDNPPADSLLDWRRGYLYAFGISPAFVAEAPLEVLPQDVEAVESGEEPAAKAPAPEEAAEEFQGPPAPPPETLRPSFRMRRAFEGAWRSAQERLATAALGVPFDAERKIEAVLRAAGGRTYNKAFRNFLLAAEPVKIFYRPDFTAGMWVKAPLYGRYGLAAILDRRASEKPVKGQKVPEETGASADRLLLVRVRLGASLPTEVLWPKLLNPTAEIFADPAALSRESAVSPRFRVLRLTRDELDREPPPGLAPVASLPARVHENGVDLILEMLPPEMETFDPGKVQGLAVIGP